MGSKRPTQAQRIIQYMDEHGSITRLQSCCELFIFELSARIVSLENRGWRFKKERISQKNNLGETKNFTRYSILERGVF